MAENNSAAAERSIAEFEATLLKFSDSLIASTSSDNSQVCVWETQTLAPLESFKSDKFLMSPNTLQVSPTGFILGTHVQKTTLAAWRWDKTSQPILKSPTKEELSVVRMCSNLQGQELLICGSKKGKILIFQMATGQLIAEVQNAHYLAINDMDLSSASDSARQGDLIITAGQDSKVKVWMLSELLSQSISSEEPSVAQSSTHGCTHQFNEHTGAVTCVKFSYGASLLRAFSGSLDKTFKVYDLPTKTILKQIQMPSPILKLSIDQVESQAFIACENLNVYVMPLAGSSNPGETHQAIQSAAACSRKRTFTHKKRITAMTLTVDNLQLVTGDTGGTIYIWNLSVEGDNSTSAPANLLQMLDIHREYGAITNLVPLTRPLSLFGLTANMQGYEPGEVKALQRQQLLPEQLNEQILTVQLAPLNTAGVQDYDSDDLDGVCGEEALAEYQELEYFCQAAASVANHSQSMGKGSSILAKKGSILAKPTPTGDFIGLDNPETSKDVGDERVGEVERLREENKRLKKTLVEKFAGDEESL